MESFNNPRQLEVAMAKPKKMGVCPMCAYSGDTAPKELKSSHVIPRNSFKALQNRMGPKLKGRYIEMASEADARLDITQDQGTTPMLCWDCEQWLGSEIEKPTRAWINNCTSDQFVEADSVLLARYAASVWWRAMLSKHKDYQHVEFDYVAIRPLMEASINPSATFKKISFRLRKLTDSSGGFSDSSLLQFQCTFVDQLSAEPHLLGHECFAVIHDGFVWEAFSPRLKRSSIDKLKCFSSNRSRYALQHLDFEKSSALKLFCAENYSKYLQGKVTPAFGRVFPHSGD